MNTLEQRLCDKLPGEDTGIVTRNSFCDVCPRPQLRRDLLCEGRQIIKAGRHGRPPHQPRPALPPGQSNRQYVYRKDRVLTPLRRVGERGEGRFEPITWDEAYDEIVTRLNTVKGAYGPPLWPLPGYNKWYRPSCSGCAMISAP